MFLEDCMPLLVDAHVHVYPSYDLEPFFANAISNLRRLTQTSTDYSYGLCLVERFDCHFFKRLLSDPSVLPPTVKIVSVHSDTCAELVVNSAATLFLYAGRQIVTAERLELLALSVDADIREGISFNEGAQLVRDAGGLPALNWAPGKWMFRRRPYVEKIIADAKVGDLLIGDTSLRPIGWGEPILMKQARQKGMAIIAGSDPLPDPREIELVGTYGLFIAEFNPRSPVQGLRAALATNKFKTIGKRGSPPSVAERIGRLFYSRGR